MAAEPYVPGVVSAVLSPALGALTPPAQAGTLLPAMYVSLVPIVVSTVLPGGGRLHRLLSACRVSVQLDSYAKESTAGALDEVQRGQALAEAAAAALTAGVGQSTEHGVIVSISTTAVPVERRESGQPDRVSHWRGVYVLTVDL